MAQIQIYDTHYGCCQCVYGGVLPPPPPLTPSSIPLDEHLLA